MRFSLYIILFIAFNSCTYTETSTQTNSKGEVDNQISGLLEYVDPHSFAKPDHAVVVHLDWQAEVDFEQKIIKAKASWKINQDRNEIHFDVRNLEIEKVTLDKEEKPAKFTLAEEVKFLGRDMSIELEENTEWVHIYYKTTQGADALQFLDPAQTAGKKHPFLFTQSQAIMARTWLPCQDSPGIRFTYNAKVKVPKGMLALMSAENPQEVEPDGEYEFKMDQPVPSYLFALAVGNMEFAPIGEITGVYAEPEVIESAVYEFALMQDMVDTAEAMYGEYKWGRYDVLVLPPSFPFGGMENPRLTFATPTIIAGDRSLTSLIAHELAHSWSGNLVTNATWEDIWLNEGFTVYFENRIMEEIYGKEFADMLALLSYQDLKKEVAAMGEDSPDTRLKVNLKGRNPDDGLSSIPYEKGFYFLKRIEETVGRENWDNFLKHYFEEFAFQVMTTEAFLFYLDQKLLSKDSSWLEKIDIKEWVYGTGIPENIPKVSSARFEQVNAEVQSFKSGTSADSLNTKNWMTAEWLNFLRKLPDSLSRQKLNELDKTFHFTNSGNSEIKAAWLEKSIAQNYGPSLEAAERFLIKVGRRKFLVPIYAALLEADTTSATAIQIYTKARPNYHAVSRETLDELLNWEERKN